MWSHGSGNFMMNEYAECFQNWEENWMEIHQSCVDEWCFKFSQRTTANESLYSEKNSYISAALNIPAEFQVMWRRKQSRELHRMNMEHNHD